MFQNPSPHLVLASASVPRAALLREAGLVFEARAAHIDEAEIKIAAQAEGASAEETALRLADLKARRIARRDPDSLVIAADQMLVCGERWFDKPTSVEEARLHLLALRGQEHRLATAVVCYLGEQRIWHHMTTPRLRMRRFSEAFLDALLMAEGSAVTTTVGAYRLEGRGILLFDAIEGSHDSILGLPMLPLLGFLRQNGLLLG